MVGLLATVINATMLSAMYALIAIGLTVIYGVGGVFNLAHGVSVTMGAYVALLISSYLGYNFWIASLAALVVPGLFSLALYWGIISSIDDRPMAVMTVTLLCEIIAESFIRIVLGAKSQAVPVLLHGQLSILDVTVQNNRVVAFVLSWVMILVLFGVFNYTMTGRAILATSMNERGAQLVGINKNRIHAYTWLVAGALAGLAGLFFGSLRTANWSLGIDSLLIAFPIVILGGIGSIRGSVVAAYIIGFINVFVFTYVNTTLASIAPLLVMIAILIAKPQGLFGREVEV